MQTKQKAGKAKQGSFFRDPDDLEVFLEAVEREARGCGVKPKNARTIIKLLEKKFGKSVGSESHHEPSKVA